ncbi:MAG: hypothetical protein ACYS8Z_08680 [Planctomycetota bacterium]|jgi:uncharacterized membrane protein (DUF106 family)
MSILTTVISWVNMLSNAFGRFCLAPIGVLPGWLSLTVISAAAGYFFLVVFKYTSNQRAIGRVKDDMKAQMLAIKLFKDSISVTLTAQGRLFKGALLLLVHAVVPMMVMILPVSLLLIQMALWYQSRPLLPQEHTVLTVELNGNIDEPWQTVSIEPDPAFDVTLGPVRIHSKRQICWEIRALQNGYSRITLRTGQQQIKKDLAVGGGLMRISSKRPKRRWADMLTHPSEEPFRPDSVVRSVSIQYPNRPASASGADWWLVYFFVASIVFAFILKPLCNVRL